MSRPLYSHNEERSTCFRRLSIAVGIAFISVLGSHGIDGSPTATPTATGFLTAKCGQACVYETLFRRAHCDQKKLSFVPLSTGCEGVSLLELQENNITSIPKEQMSGYTLVSTLDISKNRISSLEPGTFRNNDQLRNLLVSYNELHILQKGTFNGTEGSIQRIYLDNNELQVIEDGAFYGLTKLQILSLQKNGLQAVPEGLFAGLYAIEQVNLSFNLLTHISPPFKLGFVYLRVLDLRNNQLYQCASIVPLLFSITDEFHFGDNPLICDCNFITIQKWFFETNPPQQNQLGCIFDNETYLDVTDNLTIPCEDTVTDIPTQEPITRTLQALTTDGSSAVTWKKDTTSHPLHTKENQDSISRMDDDDNENLFEITVDRKILGYGYKIPWISYYTATILTIYVILRFVKWAHYQWKRRHKQVILTHFTSQTTA